MKEIADISTPIIVDSTNQEQKYSCEKLSETLSKLLTEDKISINQLHENTGVALATIKRIKYDKDANPTISSLLPIADFFSVTLNQLLGLEPLPANRAVGVYREKKELWKKIPIITWESARTWPDISTEIELNNFTATDIEVSDRAFTLIVQEENWQLFSKGTKLIFDPEKQPKHRNYVLISSADVSIPSFYQILYFDGRCYLKPPQHDYKTVEFDKNKHSIKGTMVQARMDQE